jgi:solute carrier family 25 oxoglutarate transporter 11
VDVPGQPRPGAVGVLKSIIQKEGISGVYAGLSAAVIRQATYGTARIGLHQTFSNWLIERNKGKSIPFWQKSASGMVSGAIAVVIGTPFDVALVRMQADSMRPLGERRGYKNVFDAVTRVAREEGLGRLWRGLAPNVLRGMFNNAGMLATYDQALEFSARNLFHDPDPRNPSLKSQLAASAAAGLACTVAALPFDLIKSRLQDMKADTKGVMPYKGVLDCSYKILTKEGVLAFWTGFGAYYVRSAPHAMIILMSREQIILLYNKITGIGLGDKKELK